MVWLLHKLGLVQGIWLQDHHGKTYRTWVRKTPFEKKWAPVYPFTGVGSVILNPDGTCSGSSIYIERWAPMK
jgi:hypothetical protein